MHDSNYNCDLAHIYYIYKMEHNCKECTFRSKAAGSLNDTELELLSHDSVMVKFKKGNAIVTQGAFSTNIVYLRSGLAKIHITGPYHEHIVRIVKAPRYLGLPTTIGDKINQYSVTAISNVEVCFIDISTFNIMLKSTGGFSYGIILDLCKDELESIKRCANRTQKQTQGNIADIILEFSDHIFKSDTFTLPASQSEIAELIDTSRESVSRALSEFKKDGIINLSGKKITIINKKSLMLISKNG